MRDINLSTTSWTSAFTSLLEESRGKNTHAASKKGEKINLILGHLVSLESEASEEENENDDVGNDEGPFILRNYVIEKISQLYGTILIKILKMRLG